METILNTPVVNAMYLLERFSSCKDHYDNGVTTELEYVCQVHALLSIPGKVVESDPQLKKMWHVLNDLHNAECAGFQKLIDSASAWKEQSHAHMLPVGLTDTRARELARANQSPEAAVYAIWREAQHAVAETLRQGV